jgi:CMP-N-acetylneuraminic acid synthetase
MHPLKQALYSSRTADKFVVRLPDGMRERIAEVARTQHRSMNSEIIARLEQSINQEQNVAAIDPNTVTIHERRLLNAFRKLAGNKQQALLMLCNVDDDQLDDVQDEDERIAV